MNGPDGTTAEAALVAAAKSGDREALQRLIEPHRRELQVHCYRMLGSYHDAEDLVQETFLRAWRGLRNFEGRSSMRTPSPSATMAHEVITAWWTSSATTRS